MITELLLGILFQNSASQLFDNDIEDQGDGGDRRVTPHAELVCGGVMAF